MPYFARFPISAVYHSAGVALMYVGIPWKRLEWFVLLGWKGSNYLKMANFRISQQVVNHTQDKIKYNIHASKAFFLKIRKISDISVKSGPTERNQWVNSWFLEICREKKDKVSSPLLIRASSFQLQRLSSWLQHQNLFFSKTWHPANRGQECPNMHYVDDSFAA